MGDVFIFHSIFFRQDLKDFLDFLFSQFPDETEKPESALRRKGSILILRSGGRRENS